MVDGKTIAAWSGWRRYSPAAGSIVSHAILGVALVSLIAASSKTRPAPVLPSPPQLQVTLVAETPPPVRRPPPPRAPPASSPQGEAAAPVVRDPRKNQKQSPAQPQDDSVYVPPSILAESNVPLGLQGAIAADPCKPKYGVTPKDCVTGWSARLGAIETLMPRSEDDLKRYYAEFMLTCPYKVGCGPNQRKMIQLNGAQSVVGAAMASGAAGMGGINDLVGRLQFDPDHRDPGFGD